MSKSLTSTLQSLDGEALALPSPYFISPPPAHSSAAGFEPPSHPSGFQPLLLLRLLVLNLSFFSPLLSEEGAT